MIKQLFQAKVLGTLVLAFLLLGAVSNLNEAMAQVQQDDEVPSPKLNPSELADFEAEYNLLVEEIEESTTYTETQKAVRLKFYEIMHQRVSTGYGIEDAIEASIKPTREYATKVKDGNLVNFIQLVQQAKQRFL